MDRDSKIAWTEARNIWLGVTAENQQEANKKIPLLIQTPAITRFVSIEPMLGPIDLKEAHMANVRLPRVDWVIVGAESGPDRRPCKIEWVRKIVEQCKAAGVPVFVKQLHIDGKVSSDISEWPEDLRVQEFPK